MNKNEQTKELTDKELESVSGGVNGLRLRLYYKREQAQVVAAQVASSQLVCGPVVVKDVK